MALSSAMEDYLEAVLMLQKQKGYVRCVDVAEQLGVKKPLVSRAVKELSKSGHIMKTANDTLSLTEQGLQLAAVLEREIEVQAGQISDVNEFLKLVDKYLDIPELDAAILNELVSKIVVHSPVRENGRKQVQIDLYFTYVGQILSLIHI